MKISKKQSDVIRHMRKGNKMSKNVTYVALEYSTCSTATFWALERKKIIEKKGSSKDGWGISYRLTKLGQSIEL